MTSDFEIKIERIDGSFDDPLDQASFARLQILAHDRCLTRCVDNNTGIRDYVKIPLHRLAEGIARNWWTLLYEPWRPEEITKRHIARHHLDTFIPGYIFPFLGLWSAGKEALSLQTGAALHFGTEPSRELTESEIELARRLSGPNARPLDFRTLSRVKLIDETRERMTASRREIESQFAELVTTIVEWSNSIDTTGCDLHERWDRTLQSINDPLERNYCIAAGRMGLDPYDPDSPDISVFSDKVPEDSFDDLCEAARFDELPEAVDWLVDTQKFLENAPTISLSEFGRRPRFNPAVPAWQTGYQAATELRSRLSLDDNPQRATQMLIGDTSAASIDPDAPAMIEGLLAKDECGLRSMVRARSSSQWRFRECRAVYIGWGADPDSYPLLTTATTYQQQASRAFAAELICPADYLRHIAHGRGLTGDQISDIAEILDCQTTVVEHQARNHRIPVRGMY